MKRLPYAEGSVFLVPLRGAGWSRGVVTRASARGRVLMGYFFGPRLRSPAGVGWDDLDPGRAVLRLQFGDLGLIDGSWPILGMIAGWDRSEWPTPDFIRRDSLRRTRPLLVRYADDDPSRVELERVIDDDPVMPPDILAGAGAVEIRLTKLLA